VNAGLGHQKNIDAPQYGEPNSNSFSRTTQIFLTRHQAVDLEICLH